MLSPLTLCLLFCKGALLMTHCLTVQFVKGSLCAENAELYFIQNEKHQRC